MGTLFQGVPPWVGVLGWLVVLVGYLMQRRAWINMQARIQTTVKGNQNQVTNTVNQSVPASGGEGDSPLAQWGSWASIVGLVLTLLPLVKAWMAPGP